MMYLTAQRVRSLGFQSSAVNAFLHQRTGVALPSGDPRREVAAVSQDPGDLVSMSLSMPPGGNAVEAFVDVIAEDSFGAPELVRALDLGRRGLAAAREGAWSAPGALARFYVQPNLDLRATFEDLAQVATKLLSSPRTMHSPLTIVVERVGDATYYHLDETGLDRMRRIHGPNWRSPRLRASDDIAADFAVYNDDLREHIIDTVTGMDRHYVRALGGVRFVTVSGDERGHWPALADRMRALHSVQANVPTAGFRFASEEDAANFEAVLRAKRLASSARSRDDRLVVQVVFERPNLEQIADLAESTCIEVRG
jgi:hypothetical protein